MVRSVARFLFFTLLALLGVDRARAGSGFNEESVARGLNFVVSQPNINFGFGLALVDLDSDGDADVAAVGDASGRLGLFENDGTGHFTDRTGVNPPLWTFLPSGVSAGDFDRDGDLDVFVSGLGGQVLLRNDGGFAFTDVTSAAHLFDETGAGEGSAWADVDGDGWLDLFSCRRVNTFDHQGSSRLYRNLGDGSFEDVTVAYGVDVNAPDFQPIFFDYEGDGDADLYLSTDKGFGPTYNNHLFVNEGDHFVDLTTFTGTAGNIDSMGVDIADLDGDGLEDIYCANINTGNLFFERLPSGAFREAALEYGVESDTEAWGVLFFDHDLDGWLDLFVANKFFGPNRLYDYDGKPPCTDVAAETGLQDGGLSYAAAMADIDRDGDLDLCVSNWGENLRLYVNDAANGGSSGRWLGIRLRDPRTGGPSIGGRVSVTTGLRTRQATVRAGSSYKCQSEAPVHFGLGGVTQLDALEVRWGDGAQRTLQGYGVDALWTPAHPMALGDHDGDGDADFEDRRAFAVCRQSPFRPGCEWADFDGDGDVDDVDQLAFLQRFFSEQGAATTDETGGLPHTGSAGSQGPVAPASGG